MNTVTSGYIAPMGRASNQPAPTQFEQLKMEPCSVIENRVQCIFAQLNELSDKLDMLEKKVYPVVGPIDITSDVKGNNAESLPQSELASKLNDISTRLNFAVARVVGLTSRVEL